MVVAVLMLFLAGGWLLVMVGIGAVNSAKQQSYGWLMLVAAMGPMLWGSLALLAQLGFGPSPAAGFFAFKGGLILVFGASQLLPGIMALRMPDLSGARGGSGDEKRVAWPAGSPE